MKTPKAGQLFTISGQLYRVCKATRDCAGCALNNLFACPSIKWAGEEKQINCRINNVIFKRV